MKGLLLADWLVIAPYLLNITGIGFLGARRVKSAASFFITDRKFGTLFTMFLALGSGTHDVIHVGFVSEQQILRQPHCLLAQPVILGALISFDVSIEIQHVLGMHQLEILRFKRILQVRCPVQDGTVSCC